MHSIVTSLLVAALATSGFAAAATEAAPTVLSGMEQGGTYISVDMSQEEEEIADVVVIGGADEETDIVIAEDEETAIAEAEDIAPETVEENAEEEAEEDVSVRIIDSSEEVMPGTVVPCQRGEQGNNVYVLQERLRTLGFMMEEADGIYGGRTVTHVKEVQNYLVGKTGGVAWNPDGKVSQGLADELNSYSFPKYEATVQSGDKGNQVKRVQRRLYVLGYIGYNDVDSIYGNVTKEAVTRFQKLCGLEQTGIADESTQNALFSENAPDAEQERAAHLLRVDLEEQKLYVYGWSNEDQSYTSLEKTMVCSTGKDGYETPRGTFTIEQRKGDWVYLRMYGGYARYVTVFNEDYYIHSVLYPSKGADTPLQGANGALTERVSKGSIRLSTEDAKWIYENCRLGTTIEIE